MDVDITERHNRASRAVEIEQAVRIGSALTFHEIEPGHDHARHPEIEDLLRRREQVGRIEVGQIRRVLRPAEGGMGPESGREPGVQDIFVLPTVVCAQRGLRLLSGSREAVPPPSAAAFRRRVGPPDGDTVSPPKLTTDAPGPNVLHPAQIHVFVTVRHKTDLILLHDLDGRGGERLHVHEPLLRQQRLDHLFRPF